MAPFPEVELITLDRLEVALKNKNMKLLKEGAYKLHEKYHGGHKFEYTDRLKVIYNNVVDNASIPPEIKDILCSTIKDILFEEGIEPEPFDEEEPVAQNRVSSLTQLSYNASEAQTSVAVEEPPKDTGKVSAFDVFSAPKAEETENTYTQSPFEEETNAPFQEFKMPQTAETQDNTEKNTDSYVSSPVDEISEQRTLFNQETPIVQFPADETPSSSLAFEIPDEPAKQKADTVAIFYCQDTSQEKIKNILKYRELISKLQDEHYSISEILSLISEINTQSNTNIIELKNMLDQLAISGNKVNLVTNSTSANFIGLMEECEYSYSLYKDEEDKQMNLIPVFGLSNQFICSNCGETYLDKEDKINPLVLQCPKCKSPMFPNFYTADNQNIQMNLEYYNDALLSLVNSDIWVVIHPILDDKVMTNLITSALKLNSAVKKIYILDKDINTREVFKKRFTSIKYDIDVDIYPNAHENFLNSIR